MSVLELPELSLVVLIGTSGSGKSTFAARHFGPFEVISSDFCRGLVSGDPNDQSATAAAFEVLDFIAGKRLEAGLLTVIDATNVQRDARRQLIDLAKAYDVLPVAIVLDVPESVAAARNRERPEVPGGEGRLTGSGGADQHDQRQLGELEDAHRPAWPSRWNSASWVGGPRSGSTSPTSRCSTR